VKSRSFIKKLAWWIFGIAVAAVVFLVIAVIVILNMSHFY